jgi:rare lipoprotein A
MHLSAAHPTFPLPSYARVTNVETGSSVIVRVNDRGPYHEGRLIDLSNKTADMLDLQHSGTGKVRVQYVGRARMDGHDMPYLMASYVPKGSRIPGINPGGGQIASGVMVASNNKRITADEIQSFGGFTPPQPENVPVPVSATSYAGSTPSAPYNAAPVPRPMPSGAVAQPFDQMVVLPEIGPRPYERPYGWQQGGSLAMGYQEDGVKTVTIDLAFDAVMVRNDGMTEESILASFKRQKAAKPAPK